MNKVAVYTAVFGAKDLVPDVEPMDNVDYYCYTDRDGTAGKGWKSIKVTPFCDTDRRTARWFKANSHILFREYDYVIWVDGRIQLLRPVGDYIKLLGNNHIATTKHRKRDCIYEEAKECVKHNLGNIKVINQQMDAIKQIGYPENNGLSETGVLIRDNSDIVRKFNEHWNDFLIKHSVRDQLSFNYILWKMKQGWSVVPPEYIKIGRHSNAN